MKQTATCIRVECLPYADSDPIRLVVAAEDGTVLTELRFTPARALDSAYSVARLMAQVLPVSDTHRVAQGLRRAAIRVMAARN